MSCRLSPHCFGPLTHLTQTSPRPPPPQVLIWSGKRKQPSSKNDYFPAHHLLETFKPKPNTKVELPPSLNFFRNSQWISSRLHKDRPSPLPLFKNEPYPPVLSALDSFPLRMTNSGCQSDGIGWSDPESESESGSDYSPFPFSPSAGNKKIIAMKMKIGMNMIGNVTSF